VKILYVNASYLPAVRYGGTVVSAHGLARALAARGHDVHVFTTSVNGPVDSDVPHEVPVDRDGVQVWYFRSPNLRRLYRSPALGRALAARVREFDVVHTQAVFLWPIWAAASAAAAAGVPYVVSPRGMLEKGLIASKSRILKTAWIRLVERGNLEQASAVHVTSAREAAELAAFGFRLRKVVTIPNGVDDEDVPAGGASPSPAIGAIVEHGPYVLFLGRVNWKKGLDRLVRSMAHMTPAVRVVVAGNDEEGLRPVLEAEASRVGVRDRLVFTGVVAGADKHALIANARLLVLPSYSENFGNVVVEAMSAGRAVIVTPEVGIADSVAAIGAGWVVDGEPSVLGARIAALAHDQQLAAEMGARGKLAAAREFSWSSVGARMEELYAGVMR
jgi:glycosyltransferase involved in cell wall biosynthesis